MITIAMIVAAVTAIAVASAGIARVTRIAAEVALQAATNDAAVTTAGIVAWQIVARPVIAGIVAVPRSRSAPRQLRCGGLRLASRPGRSA